MRPSSSFSAKVSTDLKVLWIWLRSLTRCASLVADQLGEAQRRESGSLAQVNAAGVAQNLPEKARGEVPEVPRSNPLGAVALRELAYHRLDAASHGRKPRRPGVAL